MTIDTLKANDNRSAYDVTLFTLPMPPLNNVDDVDVEIYARFMKHVRLVPNSRMDIKILSAMQFTSDMMDLNDAIVAKTLVDMGLRATRRSFPEAYLEHVDSALLRTGWDVGAPSAGALAIKDHWDRIGEDKFAGVRRDYSILSDPLWV